MDLVVIDGEGLLWDTATAMASHQKPFWDAISALYNPDRLVFDEVVSLFFTAQRRYLYSRMSACFTLAAIDSTIGDLDVVETAKLAKLFANKAARSIPDIQNLDACRVGNRGLVVWAEVDDIEKQKRVSEIQDFNKRGGKIAKLLNREMCPEALDLLDQQYTGNKYFVTCDFGSDLCRYMEQWGCKIVGVGVETEGSEIGVLSESGFSVGTLAELQSELDKYDKRLYNSKS